MEKDYDLDKLYIIAKHIAENDSIWEWWGYCHEFTETMFKEWLNKPHWRMWDYVESAKELYDKLFI